MNPFKVGDVVHHVKFGEGVVTKTPSNGDLFTNVKFPPIGQQDVQPVYLSFTPWPKANHERPIQDGWWLVTLEESSVPDWPMIRRKSGENMYDAHNVSTKPSTAYTFHKFLGDSWR